MSITLAKRTRRAVSHFILFNLLSNNSVLEFIGKLLVIAILE